MRKPDGHSGGTTTVFDTVDQPMPDRYEYWHAVVREAYAECDPIPVLPRDFRARTEVGDVGFAQVTSLASGPISYVRSRRDIARDGRDDVFMAYMLRGEGQFSQNGHRVRQRPGDVLFYDSGQTYQFDFQSDYQAIILRFKRAAFQSRIVTLDAMGGTLLAGSTALGALTAGLIGNAAALSNEGAVSGPVASAMLDLITTSFASGVGATEELSRGENDLLTRVKRYMLGNLADETLTLDSIAHEHNLSQRSLSRLFAREGATPMGWLQRQRLAAAYSALAEHRVRSVTDAAFSFGFNDLSHFGRAFKKVYGRTPREVMQKAG